MAMHKSWFFSGIEVRLSIIPRRARNELPIPRVPFQPMSPSGHDNRVCFQCRARGHVRSRCPLRWENPMTNNRSRKRSPIRFVSAVQPVAEVRSVYSDGRSTSPSSTSIPKEAGRWPLVDLSATTEGEGASPGENNWNNDRT
ncbi:unnamed protein product [Gordionus sp. m RMFG-2023]